MPGETTHWCMLLVRVKCKRAEFVYADLFKLSLTWQLPGTKSVPVWWKSGKCSFCLAHLTQGNSALPVVRVHLSWLSTQNAFCYKSHSPNYTHIHAALCLTFTYSHTPMDASGAIWGVQFLGQGYFD